jgi:hypothetical protein
MVIFVVGLAGPSNQVCTALSVQARCACHKHSHRVHCPLPSLCGHCSSTCPCFDILRHDCCCSCRNVTSATTMPLLSCWAHALRWCAHSACSACGRTQNVNDIRITLSALPAANLSTKPGRIVPSLCAYVFPGLSIFVIPPVCTTSCLHKQLQC